MLVAAVPVRHLRPFVREAVRRVRPSAAQGGREGRRRQGVPDPQGARRRPVEPRYPRRAENAWEHNREIVEKFQEELGRHERAVEGLAATIEALWTAQVDCLLVESSADLPDRLWIGPEPVHLAMSAEALRAFGVDDPQEAPADAALLRAAVGTDARLLALVSGEVQLADKVGAVLRYADALSKGS
ncbi:MAG: hypothetical protein M3O55_07295 [Actinomycetota bacterium]|nr:hypothetical protein [Actinomycetota bacterium]